MVFEQELDLFIRSSYPLIYIPTPEEERVEQLIGAVAEQGTPPRTVYKWDIIGAFHDPSNLHHPTDWHNTRVHQGVVWVLRNF